MSQFFISGVQSIEASASASVLPMNIQDQFGSQPYNSFDESDSFLLKVSSSYHLIMGLVSASFLLCVCARMCMHMVALGRH